MKKILVLVALVAICVVNLNAQDHLKWGVTAGMNVSKHTFTGLDNRIGVHAGVKAELGLPKVTEGAYMDFGALLSLKGSQVGLGSLASIKMNPAYLEIPVHVGYKYAVNNDFALFGNVGPYFGFGLFGKVKANVDGSIVEGSGLGSVSESENIFGEDGFKRFDFGLGLKFGAEFNQKFQVSLGYDFGLVDVSDGYGINNRNLMISLGYMF